MSVCLAWSQRPLRFRFGRRPAAVPPRSTTTTSQRPSSHQLDEYQEDDDLRPPTPPADPRLGQFRRRRVPSGGRAAGCTIGTFRPLPVASISFASRS
jgi:hypothetical protein